MKNRYEIQKDHVVIYCNSVEGLVKTIIDTTDLQLLLSRNWTWRAFYSKSKKMYVKNGSGLGLHRFILGAKKGEIVDHKDRNPLNNRRSNLRIVTPTESVRNRDTFKNNTSGYPGVSFDKTRDRWKARIRVSGKEIFLGKFKTKEEAIQARKEGEKKYW